MVVINRYQIKKVHKLVLATFENNNEQKSCVDHIDNNRTNNCLFNLRYATKSENQFNRKTNNNNTSGIKGIAWNKHRNRWRAYIRINSKLQYLGDSTNIEDAQNARQLQARELFGDYINNCEC